MESDSPKNEDAPPEQSSTEKVAATPKGSFALAAARGRNWALTILGVSLLIKVAWIIFALMDEAVRLSPMEWALLPVTATYQHMVAAFGVFVVDTLILWPGTKGPKRAKAALVAVVIVQLVLVYYHMVAFRIALIMGTFPTFALIRDALTGGVAGGSLLAVENIIYNVVATLLVVGTLLTVRKLNKVWLSWPKRKKLLAIVIPCFLWMVAGPFSARATTGDMAQADVDSVAFFFSEMVAEIIERSGGQVGDAPSSFPTAVIYGDDTVVHASELLHNRDRWRQGNKNVVLIVLESTPHRQASFMGPVIVDGQERETTPFVSSLRDNALIVDNYYTVQPTSMPALFSMACSLYPYPLRPYITDVNPRIPCMSISELLAANGYQSALFHSGRFSFYNKEEFFRDRGFGVMFDARNMPGRQGAFRYRWGIDERVTAQAIVDFVNQNKDHPFFVQYIPVFPHAPYEVPDEDLEVFENDGDRNSHHNTMRYVDSVIETIVDGLRQANVLDETLVVVVGDHGEAFREHPGNRVHSYFVYEENVHVPLAIYNPVLFEDAPSNPRVSSHVDLLPTIADLLDLPADENWQGVSLVRDGPSRLAYFVAVHGRQFVGLRDGKYKVIWNRDNESFQIFDLEQDPSEQDNLAGSLRGRVARYREALSAWRLYHIALIPNLGRRRSPTLPGEALGEEDPELVYQPHSYPPVPDRTVAGRPFRIDGIAYDHGLGTHAPAWYLYELDSDAQRIVGRVGRERRTSRGRAWAYLFVDGRLAFASGALTASAPAVSFDVDVTQASHAALVMWPGPDSNRGDHVHWVDVRVLERDRDVYQPGEGVWLDDLQPVGANGAGLGVKTVPSLPSKEVTGEAKSFSHGLLLSSGASLSFDVGVLGATRVKGTLLGAAHGQGEPIEWAEIKVGGKRVFRGEAGQGDQSIDFRIRPGSKLLTLRAAKTNTGARLVFADLLVETTKQSFEATRAKRQRIRPRVWDLASLPPAHPIPDDDEAGWRASFEGARDVPIGTKEAPNQFWIARDSQVRYNLAGLRVTQLLGKARVIGSSSCEATASIRSGDDELWSSGELAHGQDGATFDVDISGRELISLHVEGSRGCAVLWSDAVLAPPGGTKRLKSWTPPIKQKLGLR